MPIDYEFHYVSDLQFMVPVPKLDVLTKMCGVYVYSNVHLGCLSERWIGAIALAVVDASRGKKAAYVMSDRCEAAVYTKHSRGVFLLSFHRHNIGFPQVYSARFDAQCACYFPEEVQAKPMSAYGEKH